MIFPKSRRNKLGAQWLENALNELVPNTISRPRQARRIFRDRDRDCDPGEVVHLAKIVKGSR
jgi:hypothetical protein